jgi:hypothetical protein
LSSDCQPSRVVHDEEALDEGEASSFPTELPSQVDLRHSCHEDPPNSPPRLIFDIRVMKRSPATRPDDPRDEAAAQDNGVRPFAGK